jgi:hypothetical protein
MTPSRVRGSRGGAVLALAILLGPALALAAPSDGRHPGLVPGPAAASDEDALQAPDGSASTSGRVAGRVSVSAITVRLELSQPVVREGRSVQVRATVTNESAANIANVRMTIEADPSGIAFRPAEGRVIRRIAPGRDETFTWSACGQSVGVFSLVATAELAGLLVASPPELLTITAGRAC